jgi:hypothetical protein
MGRRDKENEIIKVQRKIFGGGLRGYKEEGVMAQKIKKGQEIDGQE